MFNSSEKHRIDSSTKVTNRLTCGWEKKAGENNKFNSWSMR